MTALALFPFTVLEHCLLEIFSNHFSAMLTGAQEPLFRKLAPAAAWTTPVSL